MAAPPPPDTSGLGAMRYPAGSPVILKIINPAAIKAAIDDITAGLERVTAGFANLRLLLVHEGGADTMEFDPMDPANKGSRHRAEARFTLRRKALKNQNEFARFWSVPDNLQIIWYDARIRKII
jgi:hypothetical protein